MNEAKESKTYLLDTNTISFIQDPDSIFHKEVIERFLTVLSNKEELKTSILSLYEWQYGIAHADNVDHNLTFQLRESYKHILRVFKILPLSEKGAEIFARIKAKYREEITKIIPSKAEIKKSLALRNVDLMIASSAIAEDIVLVSNDAIYHEIKNDKKICPELQLEDWTIVRE